MPALIKLRGVCAHYQSLEAETQAVKDVSFEVAEGEILSLLGPSGCGKSTLLSIMCGLIAPSAGIAERAEGVNVGYMLQRDYLFEWRTVAQNIYLGLEINGKCNKAHTDYADALIKKYGLYEFRKAKPSRLSGGMRQRAALIRTLALKPDLLLLDEPFSALDYITRLRIGGEVSSILREEGKTAVMVTHDISEAISLSDRVLVFSKRPAAIIAEHRPNFPNAHKNPTSAREEPEFRTYFNAIWKELENNEQPEAL